MSKAPKNRTTEEGLAELYGTGRHTRGLEEMSRAVDRFQGIIPPVREQRAQGMADTRGALLALHGELYAPGVTPEASGRARRLALPVLAGATAALAVLAAVLVYFLFVSGPKLPTVATIRVDAGSVTVVAEDGSRR